MVRIRLARAGMKNQPYYHLVAADKDYAATGRYLERIGYYDPKQKDNKKKLVFDKTLYDKWIAKGAQPTDTVKKLIKYALN
jgi:small subunit ribosomal protein S16